MKYIALLIILCSITTFSQNKTTEIRSTKDSTGKVTVTEAEIISKTEDITPRNFMIVINPLKFFLFYNISFYAKVSPNIALGLGIQTPTLHDFSGFGVNGEIRFHPKGKSLRGFYVAPNFSINSISQSWSFFGSSSTITTNYSSIGVLFGWQWFPGDDFSMGLGIGIDKYFRANDQVTFASEGLVPALRFDIGFAW